jgi:AcrR family transcriptional regulator
MTGVDEAITQATIDLLMENGFSGLSIERIAARAETGKTSIYRRWQSKTELVVDVLARLLPTVSAPEGKDFPATVRSIVLDILDIASASPFRHVFLSLGGEAARDAALARSVQEAIIRPRLAVVESVLRRGVESGELRTDLPVELMVDLLMGPVVYQTLIVGTQEPHAGAIRLLDEVWSLLAADPQARTTRPRAGSAGSVQE